MPDSRFYFFVRYPASAIQHCLYVLSAIEHRASAIMKQARFLVSLLFEKRMSNVQQEISNIQGEKMTIMCFLFFRLLRGRYMQNLGFFSKFCMIEPPTGAF